MQDTIHPDLITTTVSCASCGTAFEIRSTARELRLDVCSACHPAYTGRAQERASGSRVERFEQRWRSSRATPTAR